MFTGARQAFAILAASAAFGLVGNQLREEPLPLDGSLDPPPEPEAGSELVANTPAEAVARWEEGAFFLDVREFPEWEERRVAGSFSLPAAEFDARYFDVVAGFGTDLPLFVYGSEAEPHLVRRVVAKLLDLGHVDVGFVAGGAEELLSAGVGEASGPEEGT